MARPRVSAGGGIPALLYTLAMGRRAGGVLKLYRRMRSKNACKTCALGMGGQRGGMVNEAGHFPEVCKKSLQAQAGDMAGVISEEFLARTPVVRLERMTSRELEALGRVAFPMMLEADGTGSDRAGSDRAGPDGAGPDGAAPAAASNGHAHAHSPHVRRISWDQAFDRIAAGFRGVSPEEIFLYSSGRSSNEAAFLFQVVGRVFGTANINNCSYYCHSASGVALSQVYGSGTASVTLDDLREADLAIVAGSNPASNHPRLITQLVNLRRRGGRVIVVNPLRELGLVRFRIPSDWRSFLFGSDVSDLYLQPHIGGDVALFKAILKGLIERDAAGGGPIRAGGPDHAAHDGGPRPGPAIDREFIAAHTSGWAEVEADARAARWEDLVRESGVGREEIARAVDIVAGSRRGIMLWAMGLTHHVHGVDNVFALSNIALARGWLGRPGTGLLPVRGHSNVQGVGSVGVTPALKKAFAARMEELYGIRTPPRPGLDTYGAMMAAAEGRIRAAILLGGNLFASNPDRAWADGALRRIPLTVHITTKLNEGLVQGRARTTLILPALARDEERQATTQESMFNLVRCSEGGGEAPPGEMRSEVDIIASIAERILPAGRFDWSALRSHARLRAEIARAVPGYEAIGAIDATRGEFTVAGRSFHQPRFATPDGRARFHLAPVPAWPAAAGPHGVAEGGGAGGDLASAAERQAPAPVAADSGRDVTGRDFRLMTIRSEGQFNTVVYEDEDLYRGNRRRDVVMISREDARALSLAEGDRVLVTSEAGYMAASVAIVDIRAGNLAMYYPEANVLVPRRLDPRSGTPAFKSVAVHLKPLPAGAHSRHARNDHRAGTRRASEEAAGTRPHRPAERQVAGSRDERD